MAKMQQKFTFQATLAIFANGHHLNQLQMEHIILEHFGKSSWEGPREVMVKLQKNLNIHTFCSDFRPGRRVRAKMRPSFFAKTPGNSTAKNARQCIIFSDFRRCGHGQNAN